MRATLTMRATRCMILDILRIECFGELDVGITTRSYDGGGRVGALYVKEIAS